MASSEQLSTEERMRLFNKRLGALDRKRKRLLSEASGILPEQEEVEGQDDCLVDDLEEVAPVRRLGRRHSHNWFPDGPKTLDETFAWFDYNYDSMLSHQPMHGVEYIQILRNNLLLSGQTLVITAG